MLPMTCREDLRLSKVLVPSSPPARPRRNCRAPSTLLRYRTNILGRTYASSSAFTTYFSCGKFAVTQRKVSFNFRGRLWYTSTCGSRMRSWSWAATSSASRSSVARFDWGVVVRKILLSPRPDCPGEDLTSSPGGLTPTPPSKELAISSQSNEDFRISCDNVHPSRPTRKKTGCSGVPHVFRMAERASKRSRALSTAITISASRNRATLFPPSC